jgi:bifunctional DNA-binding transcriptional regulator/antitoxin component of YhaV-PrlF toxin-antitoxin module
MQRKVSRVGPATLMISLPSKWCKENNIKQGDMLEISLEKGELVISKKKLVEKPKKITIDLSRYRYFPRHLIASAYKTGYDEILARYSTEKEKKEIKYLLGYSCLGYSILEETRDHLVIKDIAKIDEKEFNSVLKKVFFLTNEIARNGLEFAKTGESTAFNELLSQRKTLHKNTDFCRRLINKNVPIQHAYSHYLFMIIKLIEILTKRYRDLCLVLSGREHFMQTYEDDWYLSPEEKGKTITPKYYKFLEKINQQVYSLINLFYKPTLEEIDLFQHNCRISAQLSYTS